MMPTFRFKQFSISDGNCGMKLSSDAVLLGSYAKPPSSGSILDIGCGCGILSLMMAQQSCSAEIYAVEINEEATNQARQNFDNSKWGKRIQVAHQSVQEFAAKSQLTYDCIISNPPYFHNQLGSEDAAERQSRHTGELSLGDLCRCVSKLLSEQGLFWLILPASERMTLLLTALQHGLYCKKVLTILDKPGKEAVRNIFCLSKTLVMKTEWEQLTIKGTNGEHTLEYKELTWEFYL